MMNILNGGAHADSNVDVQEFMIAPIGAPTFAEALRHGAEVYHALKSVLKAAGLATGLGDEGGFAPNLDSNRAALDLIVEAIGTAGLDAGRRHRARPRRRRHASSTATAATRSRARAKSSAEMIDYYVDLVDSYPIVSIEDPLDEEDWDGWSRADRAARRQGADRRRRPVRHQPRAARRAASSSAPRTRCW